MGKVFGLCMHWKSNRRFRRHPSTIDCNHHDCYQEDNRLPPITRNHSSSGYADPCLHVSQIYHDVGTESMPTNDHAASTIFSTTYEKLALHTRLSSSNIRNSGKSLDDRQNRRLSNSCSTIFIDSTLAQPDVKNMLDCVTIAIDSLIRRSHQNDDDVNSGPDKVFTSQLSCGSDDQISAHPVRRFLHELFSCAEMSSECSIVTLIYLERALAYGEIELTTESWKMLVLGAVILASKVWDDQAVWNVDYCNIANDFTVQDMNKLEREYLNFLRFNTNITSSVYARYYFELRKLAELNNISFACSPLTKQRAVQLEATSNKYANLQAYGSDGFDKSSRLTKSEITLTEPSAGCTPSSAAGGAGKGLFILS